MHFASPSREMRCPLGAMPSTRNVVKRKFITTPARKPRVHERKNGTIHSVRRTCCPRARTLYTRSTREMQTAPPLRARTRKPHSKQ